MFACAVERILLKFLSALSEGCIIFAVLYAQVRLLVILNVIILLKRNEIFHEVVNDSSA